MSWRDYFSVSIWIVIPGSTAKPIAVEARRELAESMAQILLPPDVPYLLQCWTVGCSQAGPTEWQCRTPSQTEPGP